MSYLLDPPLLVASGAAVEAASPDEQTARRGRAAVSGLFIAVSLALYANVPGLERIWRPFGSRSGREFMLTSGLGQLRRRSLKQHHHVAALSLFLMYPIWAWLGGQLVRRRSTDSA